MHNIKIGLIISISLLLFSCGSRNKSEQTEDMQWKVGIALYSFNRFPFVKSLDKANAVGATYIEGFSFQSFGNEFNNQQLLQLSDSQLREVKKMIKDHGLEMRSFYAAARSRSEWEKCFKIGKKLGVSFLVGEPDPKDLDFVDSLAGVYNVKVAIHEHAKGESRYWDPDFELNVLQGKQHIGVCADVGHWVRSGLDPVKNLKILEGRIISLHAKDVDEAGNKDANYVTIGDGVIDYKAVVKELGRQEFSGTIYVESENGGENNIEEVRESLSYLRQLSDE